MKLAYDLRNQIGDHVVVRRISGNSGVRRVIESLFRPGKRLVTDVQRSSILALLPDVISNITHVQYGKARRRTQVETLYPVGTSQRRHLEKTILAIQEFQPVDRQIVIFTRPQSEGRSA